MKYEIYYLIKSAIKLHLFQLKFIFRQMYKNVKKLGLNFREYYTFVIYIVVFRDI